jgi:two-component system response regulator YesN
MTLELYNKKGQAMVKLLICDDEIKICRLILNLIDWESLGVRVVGTANDGISALRIAEAEQPDIIITDIRMPGMDGLEMIRNIRESGLATDFIIISGYRQFDYAQKAIRYGVEDYIVKPISEKELRSMVLRIIEKRNRNRELEHGIRDAKQELRASRERVQTNLFERLINGSTPGEEAPAVLGDLSDTVRAVLIKPDLSEKDPDGELYRALLRKVDEIARNRIEEEKISCIRLLKDEGIFLAFVYREPFPIEEFLRRLKRSILMQGSAFFPRFTITIGIGKEETGQDGLASSIEGARAAVMSRLFVGVGEILSADEVRSDSRETMYDFFSHTDKAALLDQVEILNRDGVEEIVRRVGEKVTNLDTTDGIAVLRLTESILRIYLFGTEVIRKNDDEEEVRRNWNLRFHLCQSCAEVFLELADFLSEDLRELTDQSNQAELRPIREAQKYLQAHFNETVRLEDVSEKLGFNPAYFWLFGHTCG